MFSGSNSQPFLEQTAPYFNTHQIVFPLNALPSTYYSNSNCIGTLTTSPTADEETVGNAITNLLHSDVMQLYRHPVAHLYCHKFWSHVTWISVPVFRKCMKCGEDVLIVVHCHMPEMRPNIINFASVLQRGMSKHIFLYESVNDFHS